MAQQGRNTPEGQHKARQTRRAAARGWIGSALEYYDFFIYATAASLARFVAPHPGFYRGGRDFRSEFDDSGTCTVRYARLLRKLHELVPRVVSNAHACDSSRDRSERGYPHHRVSAGVVRVSFASGRNRHSDDHRRHYALRHNPVGYRRLECPRNFPNPLERPGLARSNSRGPIGV